MRTIQTEPAELLPSAPKTIDRSAGDPARALRGPGTLLIAAASHLPAALGKNNSLWQDFCQIRCRVAVFLSQELYRVIILQQTASSSVSWGSANSSDAD